MQFCSYHLSVHVQLHKLGYNIEFTDIGGGLGVDYDGTRSSSSESSVNYSIQEYVNDAIYTMVDAADKNGIPHPRRYGAACGCRLRRGAV